MNVRVYDKKRVHDMQLKVDCYTFLLKELIIRRFEAAYSTFLLNGFIIRRLRVDYSTLLLKKFIDRRLT